MENKKYKCGICGKAYGSIEERSACEVKCLKAAEEEKKRKAAAEKNERKKKLEKEISELKLKLTMLESELEKEYEGETNDEVFDQILNDFFFRYLDSSSYFKPHCNYDFSQIDFPLV